MARQGRSPRGKTIHTDRVTELHAIFRRIEDRAVFPLGEDVRLAISECADPIRAAIHLERWLAASSGPTMFLSLLNEGGLSVRWLVNLLAASHQVADILVQNPEMGAIFFEPWDPPEISELLFEGRRMLEVAHSTSHRLDRLRLLKQKWTLRIAYVDVNRLWSTHSVLEALSCLADALVRLTLEVTWAPFAAERGLPAECPVQVVAFGKLGGSEVNYSSDIDLAYILEDEINEATEAHIGRYCAIFGRALEDQMGRGMLYRVDLRLRPYGASGPMVNRMRAVEAYYERYAEVWEHLAIIRSRVIAGSLSGRWEEMRQKVAFAQNRGAWQIEELLKQRVRLEEIQKGDDLKRGSGGIRDIEFLAQTLQLVYARRFPALSARPTLEVLPALVDHELLSPADGTFLEEAYVLLRTVEHRLQLEANRQTHSLPAAEADRERLARVLGMELESELIEVLRQTRTRVRAIYENQLHPLADPSPARQFVLRAGGAADRIQLWLGRLADQDAYARAAAESEGGIERMAGVANKAPVLIDEFVTHIELLDELISGEILEATDPKARIGRANSLSVATQLARTRVATHWALTQNGSLADGLDGITDAILQRLLGGLPLECVAMGSYATHDSSLSSDADIVLFCPPGVRHLDAEQSAQEFLKAVQNLRNQGAAISVDLRLRPDGKQGMLARTYDGFRSYAQSGMDPWERLACGRSRVVVGSRQSLELLHEAADWALFTRELLENLLSVKVRLETELVNAAEIARNLKHGPGGFDDLGWLIQLMTMSNPALRNLTSTTTHNRLRDLFRGGLLNAVEIEALSEAHRVLLHTRWSIELLGLPKDTIPESPVELDLLAEGTGAQGGTELLHTIEGHRQAVRQIYLDQIARLREITI